MSSYKGDKARRKAKRFAHECHDEEFEMYMHYWRMEKKVRCVIYGSSIALLVRRKKDPLRLQRKPHIIRYIYTKIGDRRKGEAYKLLCKLRIDNTEATIYCINNAAIELFEKSKFVYNGNKCFMGYPMYRFPI